jgi:DNA gyrase subunit A
MKKDKQPKVSPPQITLQNISSEMREAYLDYAMSVIVARALPDVRDGLKPVQRRIIYTMKELGLRSTSKFMKSARVVGETLGKYHPHSDVAVYDALVRMAQTFSLRYPLVHGQGNFGSIDGDSAAAMRYTEAKMSKIADELLADIDKDTVEFAPTYDGSRNEPTVLPAHIPNLLLNGTLGIAVGMATSIPPHNLVELVDATIALIDKPKIAMDELTKIVKGPDFPTGGIIFNKNDIAQAYATGRGGVVMRGEVDISEKGKGHSIVINSLPYQVNKAELIEKVADMVKDKKMEGIRDIRDESDKRGLTISIDLKNDAYPQKVLNSLYKHTDLEKVFHFNMVALSGGLQPVTLSLKSYLEEFVETRILMVERRTRHDLKNAEDRAHILEGLKKALDHIDKIIATIKKSSDRETAHKNLVKNFKLSDRQATAILEMRLATLSGLERKKIENELSQVKALIKELKAILGDPKKVLSVIKGELTNAKEKYGDERKTHVIASGTTTIAIEDMIPDEEHVVLMTRDGFLKRLKPKDFRAQRRGGKGIVGGEWKEEDVVIEFAAAGTHDTLLFFSTTGKVYETKTYEIPETSRTAKGKAIVNFLPLSPNEEITSFVAVPKKKKGHHAFLFMATKRGIIKKTDLDTFTGVRRSGMIAMKLQKGDALGWVRIAEHGDDCMLFTKRGQAIRFSEAKTRVMGRQAQGVKGIKLSSADELVGCEISAKGNQGLEVFSVSALGYGKKTLVKEFKTQSRGGTGIKVMNINAKTGELVSVKILDSDAEEYIAISQKGKTLRSHTKEIPDLGRATQGVRIMRLEGRDKVSSVAIL